MLDFALSQCCDVDLHRPPSCAQAGLHRHASMRCVCHLGGTSGQPDANDDHVKRDRDDGGDLSIRNNILVRLLRITGK